MDARIGGGYRMSSTNFSTGSSHSFSVRYTELVAGQRIRHTDTFDDPNLPGEMRVSIDLKAVICGTELVVLQEEIPSSISVEFCYLAGRNPLKCWRASSNRIFLIMADGSLKLFLSAA